MKPNYELKPAMKMMQIKSLRKHQIKPIQSLLKGEDVIVIAATSAGKSAIYELPALTQPNRLTLVIEPTLSLIYAQVKELQELGVAADYLDHFRTKKDTEVILSKVQRGRLTFLYVTPERLQSKKFRETMRQVKLHMMVIDECHCVTEWGNTFRDAYLHIGEFLAILPHRPIVCACSATVLEEQISEITALLHLRQPKLYRSDLERKNLILLKRDMTSSSKSLEKRLQERFHAVRKVVQKYHGNSSVVIYTLTTGYTDALYNYLSEHFPGQIARYHAQMKSKEQHQMELDFLQGKRKIMIATTAFGMGIHVPDIELVIHLNTPISMVDYIQQIGRAGHNGRKAHCVLFFEKNGDDKQIVQSFFKKAKQERSGAEKVLRERYQQIQSFARSDQCMMQGILDYLGQPLKKTCKRCTNCAKKRRGR